MRNRRPPFTLVLSTLVAAAALAIVLAGRGSTHHPTTGTPPTIGIGTTTACVTTRAAAQSDDRSGIVANATANAPVRVTEQAGGPKGLATVTRSEIVGARVSTTQPLEVKRTAVAHARVCAKGDSTTAARTTALRSAYARALAAAQKLAARQAGQSLKQLIHSEYPKVLAEAQSDAAARAHRLALAAGPELAARAQAEARQRAGV